jgi:hypothetical protein
MKKTRGKKSRATVPLSYISIAIYSIYRMYVYTVRTSQDIRHRIPLKPVGILLCVHTHTHTHPHTPTHKHTYLY